MELIHVTTVTVKFVRGVVCAVLTVDQVKATVSASFITYLLLVFIREEGILMKLCHLSSEQMY